MKWIILALLVVAYYWWRTRAPKPYVPHDPNPPAPSPIKREEQSADPVAEVELGEDKPIDPDKSKPHDPDKD